MSRSWLNTVHAVAALVLMALFFSFAIGTGLGLTFGGGSVVLGTIENIRGRGIVFGILIGVTLAVAGLVVLWSIFPRIDKFPAPGPELDEKDQPELFKEIRRIAASTGETAPAHVYLVSEVNAFVAQRGGWMGLGSQRVMGLGLPLLNALTVSELRAVLAHEFGHFVGGDTKLGKWIHKTRSAMARTLDNLANTGNVFSEAGSVALIFVVVLAPFRWFFTLYMRFTQSLSRRQELAADALAAEVESARALITGLTKSEQAGMAYQSFMNNEVSPLLNQGFLPPIGKGFQQFLSVQTIADTLKRAVDESMKEGKADPYDSHPPLKERVAAIEHLARNDGRPDNRPAVELLRDVPALEALLAKEWVEHLELKVITWEKSGAAWGKNWRLWIRPLQGKFDGVRLREISREPAALRELAKRHLAGQVTSLNDEQLRHWAIDVLVLFMMVALLDHGFEAIALPGQPVVFKRGEQRVEVGPELAKYLNGELDEATWQALLSDLGIGDIEMGSLIATAA